MCNDGLGKAIQVLPRLSGSHNLTELFDALGYRFIANEDGGVVLDDGVMVANVVGREVTLVQGLPNAILAREIIDTQWKEFQQRNQWQVAVHEAGHAVAAVILGFEVESVSLEGDDGGGVTLVPCDEDRTEERAEYQAAGAAAEVLFFGTYNRHGAGKDRKWVQGLTGSGGEVFESYVQQVGAKLRKKAVDAVASALNERAYLTGAEVRALCDVPENGGGSG